MDITDQQLAEQMIRMHEANLADLRATPDSAYADIAFCIERVSFWSARLGADFRTMTGSVR